MIRSATVIAFWASLTMACGDGNGPPPPPPPGPTPHHLAFTGQPTRALLDSVVAPSFTVEVRDSIDRRITTSTIPVSIQIVANPGAATLSGSTTVSPMNGVATFSTLKFSSRGRGYTLRATAGTVTPDTSRPFDIVTPVVADVLAAGSDHVCGIKLGVATYCWGNGGSGELGDGLMVNQPFPVVVSGGLQFTHLAAGFAATCGITSAGIAYCWGQNLDGKLGDSTYTDRGVPTAVVGGHTYVDAPNQGFFHACALGTGGNAYCWGFSNVGQLGDSTRNSSLAPVAVVGGLTFATLSTTNFHTCGLTPDHHAYCWGSNVRGGLGDSTNVEKLAPAPVHGGLTFSTIGAGSSTTCALTTAGAPYCWGGDTQGLWVPQPVPGGRTSVSLSMGGLFACGLAADSLAYCWGGIPGGGNPAPAPVSPTLKFTALAAGFAHACGRTRQGYVYCWGTNPRGQLGDGTTNDSAVPLLVLY